MHLTKHARERIQEMSITENDVHQVCCHYTVKRPARDGFILTNETHPEFAVVVAGDWRPGGYRVVTVVPRTYERYERKK